MKIGLEVHVQLPTESKMFCTCPTTDADGPNVHVCPGCLGMPGTRPVLNKKVLEHGIKLAKMLGCKINTTTWFSRKTYFYPDMSKGIQVTQYESPVGEKGMYYLNGKKPIRITRIHLEEDPGKTKRVGDESSLIDYNRAGIPLAEIVTEPDLKTPQEAREFLGQLIKDIRCVIDLPGDGERSIRCDCNISVGVERCEVKNVTGLKSVERALTYEVVRQTKILRAGGKIDRETRRFDEERGVTVSVRKKEFEADYGYIDEPDLGMFDISELAESIQIRESPLNKTLRLADEYGIDEKFAKQLVTTSMDLADIFEDIAKMSDTNIAKKWISVITANWKIFEEKGSMNKEGILEIVEKFVKGETKDTECGLELKSYMTGTDVAALSNESADLNSAISKYLDEHPEIVEDYRKNDKAINRVIGYVMKQIGGGYSSSDVVEAAKKLVEERL
jgi:aspartyl-tRNA(Asn)/glutamyl-tRNA(Gln) amidotransferase subunit B